MLTGTVEYQDGADRRRAPYICIGTQKEAGVRVLVARTHRFAGSHDRARAGVLRQERRRPWSCRDDLHRGGCRQVGRGPQGRAAAARAKAEAVSPDELKNFDASAQEYANDRRGSCSVFKATDATTDATDFLNACVARMNTARVAKLTTVAGAPTK